MSINGTRQERMIICRNPTIKVVFYIKRLLRLAALSLLPALVGWLLELFIHHAQPGHFFLAGTVVLLFMCYLGHFLVRRTASIRQSILLGLWPLAIVALYSLSTPLASTKLYYLTFPLVQHAVWIVQILGPGAPTFGRHILLLCAALMILAFAIGLLIPKKPPAKVSLDT
jgi:hypothetical protein